MTHLTLSLLGPLHMTLDGQPANGFAYNKARALLAYLAVESHRAHSREALVGLLWPDLPEEAARGNLRQALASLRQTIGDAATSTPFLHVTRDSIQLSAASSHSLDVTAFTQHLAACERHPHRYAERCATCMVHMEQAVALYQGDFLAGFSLTGGAPFEEWVLLWRERLRQLVQGALARLADYHERQGANEKACRAAARQLELDPWREEAHRQMMRLLVASGQRSAALAQYERCRRVLQRELGVEPEAETTALYRCIRDGLPTRVHQATQPIEPAAMLRIPPAPLIGRERELVRLNALLADPAHRLISVLGPAGIGKTRLALTAAAAQADAFPDGVVFVPIAAASTAEQLAALVLVTLDAPAREQRSPQGQLLGYLRNKEMLLVLDGFEAIANGGGELIGELVQRVPSVTLLVTSRTRLDLRAEWLLTLVGLSFPSGEALDGMEAYGAVRLFVQQLHQLQGHGPANVEEWQTAARICRMVEGNPLAIEQAAAAAWESSILQTATALETGLGVRKAQLQDAQARHLPKPAAFEQSASLWLHGEQHVLGRQSVYCGWS